MLLEITNLPTPISPVFHPETYKTNFTYYQYIVFIEYERECLLPYLSIYLSIYFPMCGGGGEGVCFKPMSIKQACPAVLLTKTRQFDCSVSDSHFVLCCFNP